MTNPSVIPESQPSLIDELLARQDDVIEQLESLEQKLLDTIEEIRPSKRDADPSLENTSLGKDTGRSTNAESLADRAA